jgi:hypothetical protein
MEIKKEKDKVIDLELEKEIMNEYYEKLNKYLELKNKYESKIEKEKYKILNNKELTIKEKRRKIKSIKGSCIKCKRKVNSIFKNDGNKLLALCGDNEKPCSLNILITKPEIIDIEKEYLKSLEEIENLTTGLLKMHYNLLFSIDNEKK